MFSFDPPENIGKHLVFLCFQGRSKWNIGKKRLNLDRIRLRAIDLIDTHLKSIDDIIKVTLDGIDEMLQLNVDRSSNMGNRNTCRLSSWNYKQTRKTYKKSPL